MKKIFSVPVVFILTLVSIPALSQTRDILVGTGPGGGTPQNTVIKEFYNAAKAGSISTVESMISKYPEIVHMRYKGKDNNRTALHVAAGKAHKQVCEILIRNGADVDAKFGDGWTALHLAADGNYPDVCELLLKNGADVNAKNNKGYTPLDWVTFKDRDVKKLLREHGGKKGRGIR
jgi:hypothetical protein